MAELPLEIRRAFFGRFGSALRPLQQDAFDALIETRDGIVCAPTSSGKTEAVFVPVACRLLDRPGDQRRRLGALVVCPTRALATDLHTRMAPAFSALGLRLDVATGDRDTRSATEGSDVLIRTPEGLDGTVCRHPEMLRDVRDVVIDEIHTFLDSPRGTQLVGLLQRLTQISPEHRRLGVSATIPDRGQPVRSRLLRENPVVVTGGEAGDIELIKHKWIGAPEQGVESFLRRLREVGMRKAIGFVRSRARAEELVALLAVDFLRDRVFVHHGATSSALRRQTEERLRRQPVALVVATTTLEVGIDIGDVDTCILFDAPPNGQSLLQRAGRAGRRGAGRRVLYVCDLYDRATSFARVLSEARIESAARRRDSRPFLSGCFQQIVSLVAASGGTRADVLDFLVTAFGVTEPIAAAMLRCLMEEHFLDGDDSNLQLSDITQRMLDDRSIHLTFSGVSGAPVLDERTRQHIGYARVGGHDTILLGGRSLKVVGADERTGQALTVSGVGGQASFAPPRMSAFEQLAVRHIARMGGKVRNPRPET